MVSQGYKKLVLIIIAAAVAVFVIVLLAEQKPYKKSADTVRSIERKPVRGPLVDPGQVKIQTVEELGINSADPEAMAAEADRFFENRQYAQAIELYRKAIGINPSDIDSHNDLGLALFYTGKPQEAVEILRKGTSVAPSYQRIWLSLGFVMISTGNKKDAREALTRARDLGPDSIIGKEAVKMLNSAGL